MKETFNKEFSDAFRAKENEIARIREKNIRISKIISQLKLNDSLIEPSLDIEEQPDRLLSVDDSEVTVEKYISPEELKRIEEAEKSEEARILAEMGDNPRDRALNMMMGGRLEANVEEDLFKVMQFFNEHVGFTLALRDGIRLVLYFFSVIRTWLNQSLCPRTPLS